MTGWGELREERDKGGEKNNYWEEDEKRRGDKNIIVYKPMATFRAIATLFILDKNWLFYLMSLSSTIYV